MNDDAHGMADAIASIDDDVSVLNGYVVAYSYLDVDGEPPIETARRELAEEIDLVAGSIEPLLSIFTTPGGNDEVIHIFLARDLSAASEVFVREQEEADIRLEWIPLEDAVDAVMAGRMRNAILAAGVLATAERLRRG